MLNKTISSILIFMMVFPVLVWADTGTVQMGGEHSYKAVRIPPAIYNKANRDLSDLLMSDDKGNPVPYFINSLETTKTEKLTTTYPLIFADSYVKDGDSYTHYFMEGNEQKDILATSITVETRASVFAKNIELRGSFDGVVWDFIQTDKLYRVEENEKLSIAFQQPLKYTHYKFKIEDNAEQVSFDDVSLEYNHVTVNQSLFTETITSEFEVEENEKTTIIKLYGLKNLKINEVTIESDSQFKRSVYFAGSHTKTLYNLSFENAVYQDTTLSFNGYTEENDVLELRINNGDDVPIQINKVTITYFADEIIFKGQESAAYTLSFGDRTVTKAPVYDIVNYKDFILKEGYDILTIENIKTEAPVKEPEEPDYSMAFNIVVVLVSLLLGYVILTRLKRSRS